MQVSSNPPTNVIYRRQHNVLSAVVNDELVMMSVATAKYFNLNAIGAHIWRLMAVPQSLDSIVAALMDSYDAPEATIREEVLRFLSRLERENMVVAASSDAS